MGAANKSSKARPSSASSIEDMESVSLQNDESMEDVEQHYNQLKAKSSSFGKDDCVTGWNSLFTHSEDPYTNLQFLEHRDEHTPALVVVDIADVNLAPVPEIWKNMRVGFFIGKKPNYHVVNDSLLRAWKPKQRVDFERIDGDFFYFKFRSFQDSQRVLEVGSWFVFGFLWFSEDDLNHRPFKRQS